MSIYAWLTMIVSVGGVTFLLLWCFYKVLTTPHELEKIHGFEASEMPALKQKKKKRFFRRASSHNR